MMHEYHVTPWELNANCTSELLHLMLEARAERIRRLNETLEDGPNRRVSPETLFRQMGINPKRKN